MGHSENRREYLDQKYAEVDGESNVKHSKSKKKSRPKKADHKHVFENCVLREEVKVPQQNAVGYEIHEYYRLGGVCKVCGRIGGFDRNKDEYGWFDSARRNNLIFASLRDDYQDIVRKYREVLPTYNVPEGFGTKYISLDGDFLPKPHEIVKEFE